MLRLKACTTSGSIQLRRARVGRGSWRECVPAPCVRQPSLTRCAWPGDMPEHTHVLYSVLLLLESRKANRPASAGLL